MTAVLLVVAPPHGGGRRGREPLRLRSWVRGRRRSERGATLAGATSAVQRGGGSVARMLMRRDGTCTTRPARNPCDGRSTARSADVGRRDPSGGAALRPGGGRPLPHLLR